MKERRKPEYPEKTPDDASEIPLTKAPELKPQLRLKPALYHWWHRLVGLVVKASAPRAGDPRFESHLRRDFFGVESYQ